jgi:hypothetical protein
MICQQSGSVGARAFPPMDFISVLMAVLTTPQRHRSLARQLITIADFPPFCNNVVAKMTEAIVD